MFHPRMCRLTLSEIYSSVFIKSSLATIDCLRLLLLLENQDMCVSMPSAVRSSRVEGGHGIFNVCNDLSACCAHESETGSVQFGRFTGWSSLGRISSSCSWLEHLTVTPLTRVRFPPVQQGILFPGSTSSADSLSVFVHPRVQSHALAYVRTIKIL